MPDSPGRQAEAGRTVPADARLTPMLRSRVLRRLPFQPLPARRSPPDPRLPPSYQAARRRAALLLGVLAAGAVGSGAGSAAMIPSRYAAGGHTRGSQICPPWQIAQPDGSRIVDSGRSMASPYHNQAEVMAADREYAGQFIPAGDPHHACHPNPMKADCQRCAGQSRQPQIIIAPMPLAAGRQISAQCALAAAPVVTVAGFSADRCRGRRASQRGACDPRTHDLLHTAQAKHRQAGATAVRFPLVSRLVAVESCPSWAETVISFAFESCF
jgi:hypothetical protein